MNWIKITAYAILALPWLWSTTLQAQVNQSPDSLRFDPVTGLPVEEETEPDTTLQFDPETGLPLVKAPDTIAIPQFDPKTGLPVKAEPEAPAQPQFDPEAGELIPPEPAEIGAGPPLFTEAALRTMALKNAARNHNTAAWGVRGACLGCGGMYLGAMFGETVASNGKRGFIDGAFVGAILMPAGLLRAASVNNIAVPIPEELESADPELREQYRQLYQAETRRLKRKSIYMGAVVFTAAPIVLLLYLKLLLSM